LGNSADLYSLAVTIYCLISKTTNSDLGKLIDSRNVLSISALDNRVSIKFKLWLSVCLEPDPQDRFPNAKKAISELGKIRSFEPDRNIPNKFKLKKKKQKIFNLKTIAGLAILAVVIFGVFVLGKHIITYMSTIDWNAPIPTDPIPTDPSSDELELDVLIKGLLSVLKAMIFIPLTLGLLAIPFFHMQGNFEIVLHLMILLPIIATGTILLSTLILGI